MKLAFFFLPSNIIILVVSFIFVSIAQSQTLNFNVSSSSAIVSQNTNFTYSNVSVALANQSFIQFIFTVNGVSQTQTPYNPNFTVVLNGQVLTSCTNFVSINSISCTISKNVTTNWSIILTNARNPPSTQPYYVTLSVTTLGISYTGNKTITLTQVPSLQLLLLTMNRNIGINTSGTFFFSTNQPFITNTLVNFTFPSYTNPLVPGTSTDYSLTKTSATTLLATSWSVLSSSGRSITFNLTNPQAAISYTISYTISYIQNGTQYQVQQGSGTVQLTPATFAPLSRTGSMIMGVSNNITFVGTCSFAAVSPVQITATYNNAQLSISNCTVSSANSSLSVCTSTSSSTTLLLTNFTANIINGSDITITSFTTFNGSLQPLCSSSSILTFLPQTLTNPSSIQANQGCSNYEVNQNNTVVIVVNAYKAQIGDIIQIGIDPSLVIQGSNWNKSTTSSETVLYYTHIILSTQINTSSTPANIQINLTYTNPSYLNSNYGLLSTKVYRSTLSFAQTSNSLSTVAAPLCPVNASGTFSNFNYTNSPTSLTTYAQFIWSFSILLSLSDYTTQDYLSIVISNALSAFDGGKFQCSIQSKVCNFTKVSSNELQIFFTSLTNIKNLNISLKYVLNPIKTNTPPIFNFKTYSSKYSAIKQSYSLQPISTLNTFTPNISLSSVILNTNSTITLQITNEYRSFVYNDGQGNSNIEVAMPFNCSAAANTSTSIINVSISSTTSTQTKVTGVWLNDGSKSLGLSFLCFIPIFNSSAINYTMTFSQKFGGVQGSSSTNRISNACGDNCYRCNAGTTVCTQCLNSSYTINTVLFQGSCFTACPSNAYQVNVTYCVRCNSPCQTCTGPSSSNCKTCIDNFELQGAVCVSVCGGGLYFNNGQCLSCHINCLNCLNSTLCFQCKVDAVMLPTNICQFTNCTDPCLTCQSSITTCTSCVDSYYLYKQQCFSQCPDQTYISDESARICSDILEKTLYFPMTIASIIVIFVGLGLKLFLNNPNLEIINLLGVIFSYIQLMANGFLLGYAFNVAVTALTALVFVLGYIMNIIYVILYFVKRNYPSQTAQKKQVKIQHSPLKPNKSNKKQQPTKNNTKSNLSKSKSKSKIKQNQAQGVSKVNLKPSVQQIRSQISQEFQDTRQQITWKQVLLLLLCGILTLRTHRVILSGLFKSKIQRGKRVPLIVPPPPKFLFWTIVLTLLLLTLPQMIAAVVQISLVPGDYLAKLFIGIDTLLAVLLSSTLRVWDLCKWKWDAKFFVAPFGNATQENMKTYLDDDQANRKTLQEARQTKKMQYSPKKSSIFKSPTIHKSKLSPKNGIKIDDDELPDVKIFDAIDDGQDHKVKAQKLRKWNAGNKNRNRMSQDNMRTKKEKMNWKLEDIYLGFVDPDAPENQIEDIDLQNMSDDRTQAYLKGATKANFRQLQDHLQDQITNQDNFDEIDLASRSPKTVINQFIVKDQEQSQKKQKDQNLEKQQKLKIQEEKSKDNLDFNIEDL